MASDERLKVKDRTKDYDYERLIREEKDHFARQEITEDLREGGLHAGASWDYYWDRLTERLKPSGFAPMRTYLSKLGAGLGRTLRILSLGSGYCGYELRFAREQTGEYEILCTDLTDDLFAQARVQCEEEGLALRFQVADLNFIEIDAAAWDVIFAHAAIHHVINLEHLFDQIAGGLAEEGIFHLVEVVGRNRTLIWDENLRFANELLARVPEEVTRGARIKVEPEPEGMEGVRQEEILPALEERFTPVFEYRHGAFMRFICTMEPLGQYFDPGRPLARRYLDLLIDADERAVRHGVLRALEIWGIYRAKPGSR